MNAGRRSLLQAPSPEEVDTTIAASDAAPAPEGEEQTVGDVVSNALGDASDDVSNALNTASDAVEGTFTGVVDILQSLAGGA